LTSKKEQFYIQRISELEAQLKQRDERIAELEKQVAELMEQVGKLTDKVAKLSKNSSNSSKPNRGTPYLFLPLIRGIKVVRLPHRG